MCVFVGISSISPGRVSVVACSEDPFVANGECHCRSHVCHKTGEGFPGKGGERRGNGFPLSNLTSW